MHAGASRFKAAKQSIGPMFVDETAFSPCRFSLTPIRSGKSGDALPARRAFLERSSGTHGPGQGRNRDLR